MTPDQFEVVARLLQTKEPARTAARLVLIDGKRVTAAADQTGVLQPSVSRAVRRIRVQHEVLLAVYSSKK